MQHLKLAILPMAVLGLGTAQVCSGTENDAWQFEVTPYLLAAGLNGDVGVHGVTADVDMSFSDLWDKFDSGLMGLFTARKGPWFYGLEGVYFKLEDQATNSATGSFGQVTVNGALDAAASMYIYQGSVGYQLMNAKTVVDLIGGLRYTKLDVDMNVAITTTPAIVFPGGATSASGSESWTDGIIGLRVLQPVADHWSLLGYVDAGAGGSDFTYQVIAGANWAYAEDFTIKAGYRHLYWDYKQDGATWDMTASGPYIGLGIKF